MHCPRREGDQQRAGHRAEQPADQGADLGAVHQVRLLKYGGLGQVADRRVSRREDVDMTGFDACQEKIVDDLLGAVHVGEHEVEPASHDDLRRG